ncbi:MAG: T9SS type A sorting domain-containing protein [Ignavibacteriaceae bacterium]|nr:T9SS type A sorting domain-containing protein [Ignavibacteriaceae bacterium]
MRKSIFIMAVSLLFLTITNAQWIQTNGPVGSVTSLAFDGGNLYTCSSENFINTTSDSGSTWRSLNSSVAQTGTVVGNIGSRVLMYSTGKIYYSDNNGLTWNSGASKINQYEYYQFYADADTVYFVGRGATYKSTNRGVDWKVYLESMTLLMRSMITNNKTIFMGYAEKGIGSSTNGGLTWTKLDSGIVWESANYKPILSLCTIGSTTFCLAGGGYGKIYKLAAQSSVWQPVNNAPFSSSLLITLASNGNTLFVSSDKGVFRSTDEGANWEKLSFTAPLPQFISFAFDGKKVYAGAILDNVYGHFGGVYFSNNLGDMWRIISQEATLSSVTGITSLSGNLYAVGIGKSSLSNFVKSTDKGKNWTSGTKPPIEMINGIVESSGDLFCYGTNSSGTVGKGIQKSTDEGKTWIPSGLPVANPLINYLVKAGTKLFTGINYVSGPMNPMVYASTDNSASWVKSANGIPNGVCGSNIVELNGKLFLGAQTKLYVSEDGGANWTVQQTNLAANVYYDGLRVCNNVLYNYDAYISPYKFYRSTDGVNWTNITNTFSTDPNATVSSIVIKDSVMFAGTGSAGIFKSTDNGINWKAINEGIWMNYPNTPRVFVGDDYLLAGGSSGLWRRQLTDFGITDVKEISNVVPEAFELSQNYPNPFNPSTVISWQLAVGSNVTLKVYDVLGKEVATLVNNELQAGTYSVNFNASNLSSGIYFYALRAGNYAQTKKMILLR